MSGIKSFTYGLVGGMVGAAALVALSSMVLMKGGIELPLLVSGVTDSSSKSQVILFGILTSRRKSTKAKLTIEPFKITAVDSFSAVGAMFPLPTSCMPTEVPEPKSVKLYSADGQSTIDGTISISKSGLVTISSPSAVAAGSAWGLAEFASIDFSIAPQ